MSWFDDLFGWLGGGGGVDSGSELDFWGFGDTVDQYSPTDYWGSGGDVFDAFDPGSSAFATGGTGSFFDDLFDPFDPESGIFATGGTGSFFGYDPTNPNDLARMLALEETPEQQFGRAMNNWLNLGNSIPIPMNIQRMIANEETPQQQFDRVNRNWNYDTGGWVTPGQTQYGMVPSGSSAGITPTTTAADSSGMGVADIARLAASIAGLGGAITGLLANLDAGDAAEEMARLNQEAAAREAAAARRQAEDEEEKLRNRTDRLLGRQRALYARGGVRMSGSVLDVMQDTENMAQKDIEAIRAYGELGVRQAETAGRIAGMEGSAYRTASNWNAAGSLLTGLANAGKALSGML